MRCGRGGMTAGPRDCVVVILSEGLRKYLTDINNNLNEMENTQYETN